MNLVRYPFLLTIKSTHLSIDRILLSKTLTNTLSIVVLTPIENSSKSSRSIFFPKQLCEISFRQCGKYFQLSLDEEHMLQ